MLPPSDVDDTADTIELCGGIKLMLPSNSEATATRVRAVISAWQTLAANTNAWRSP
jgi:hypothetical protein